MWEVPSNLDFWLGVYCGVLVSVFIGWCVMFIREARARQIRYEPELHMQISSGDDVEDGPRWV